MIDNTDISPRSYQDEQKSKMGRPSKGVTITNKASRLITLIITRTERVSLLPTEAKEVSKEQMSAIKKNTGAMTYFDSGELIEG